MRTQTLTPLNIKLNKIIEEKPEDKVAKFKSMDDDSPGEPLRHVGLV